MKDSADKSSASLIEKNLQNLRLIIRADSY